MLCTWTKPMYYSIVRGSWPNLDVRNDIERIKSIIFMPSLLSILINEIHSRESLNKQPF